MQAPTEAKFTFNPANAKHKVFKNPIGFIIWSCIAVRHIRDQNFNDNIMALAIDVYRFNPETYQDFKHLVRCSNARSFGRDTIEEKPAWHLPQTELSDEFWLQVWRYIKYKTPRYKHQLSLFNDHLLQLKITIES